MQRVWQYLRRFNKDPREIQDFEFVPQTTEGSPMECLKVLLKLVQFFFSQPTHSQKSFIYVMRAVGKKKTHSKNCLPQWSARIHDENLFNSFLIIHYSVLVSGLHLLR